MCCSNCVAIKFLNAVYINNNVYDVLLVFDLMCNIRLSFGLKLKLVKKRQKSSFLAHFGDPPEKVWFWGSVGFSDMGSFQNPITFVQVAHFPLFWGFFGVPSQNRPKT